MEVTGTRAMATVVIVDTITTTTLVTMATVPDMITVSTDECVVLLYSLGKPVHHGIESYLAGKIFTYQCFLQFELCRLCNCKHEGDFEPVCLTDQGNGNYGKTPRRGGHQTGYKPY